MTPRLDWIKGPWPGKLAISARPRGGDWLEDEVSVWREAGVDAILSRLTPQEHRDLQREAQLSFAQSGGVRFWSLPVEDRGVPSSGDDVSRAIEKGGEMRRQGRNVAVPCRQGIGRSSMIAAAVLIKEGSAPDQALTLIREVRGVPVPETPEQFEWVRKFSERETPATRRLTRASAK